MDWEQVVVGALVVLVFAAFLKEWLRPDLVAMGALVVLLLTGILGEAELGKVFGNGAPITVACMFIMSAALERTGVIDAMGAWFGRVATNEWRILGLLILIVAPLSAFVNNTPVVVIFMPILLQICRKRDLKASRFLIPLSYVAIAGGTCTLIGTSTNIIASSTAQLTAAEKYPDLAWEPFTMFEMAPLGLIFVALTGVYLATIGRKLLPDRITLSTLFDSEQSREFLTQGVIGAESRLIGKNFTETPLAKVRGVRMIEIRRDGETVKKALNKVTFKEGDRLLFKSQMAGMMEISEARGIDLDLGLDRVRTESAVLMEGIIGPDSTLVGKTLKQLNFRQRFGVIILAVHRRGQNLRERFEDVELEFGDTILVEGPAAKMQALFGERDFVNLSEPSGQRIRRSKAPFALGAIGLFMGLGSFSSDLGIPIVALALAAVFLVMATRSIDGKEAYEAVEWKVIFMIFGMLGLGLGMQITGLDKTIAGGLSSVFKSWGPWVMLSVVYLLAAVLTEMISNNAVATLLTPLAMTIGIGMEVDPRPFIVAVMFGSSASFATPIGYQTNTYVYGAGGYRFSDFTRAGLPLAVLLWIAASFLIPQIWPFEQP